VGAGELLTLGRRTARRGWRAVRQGACVGTNTSVGALAEAATHATRPAAALALTGEPRLAWTVTTPVPGASNPAEVAGSPDEASGDWVARLATPGRDRDAAIEELHGLLLRAARFEISRRRASLPQLGGSDHDDLARQSAADALMSILRRLGDFRGESRFTTWAYKFAVMEAGVKVRRRAWHGREIPLEPARWPLLTDGAPTPHQHAEARDLLAALREEITRGLTGHQREVLVAVALNEVPIDVLAERLNTTRGALYKTLHDARRKLRAALAARGLGSDAAEGGP
jgi:RNA polymerase sigma-70 factor, ECF subfamily